MAARDEEGAGTVPPPQTFVVLPAPRPGDAGPNPDGEAPAAEAARLARAARHVQVAWHKKWRKRGPSPDDLRAFFGAPVKIFAEHFLHLGGGGSERGTDPHRDPQHLRSEDLSAFVAEVPERMGTG